MEKEIPHKTPGRTTDVLGIIVVAFQVTALAWYCLINFWTAQNCDIQNTAAGLGAAMCTVYIALVTIFVIATEVILILEQQRTNLAMIHAWLNFAVTSLILHLMTVFANEYLLVEMLFYVLLMVTLYSSLPLVVNIYHSFHYKRSEEPVIGTVMYSITYYQACIGLFDEQKVLHFMGVFYEIGKEILNENVLPHGLALYQ
ncbi:unnamed protein product [Allacma fusca]|uniref:Uncharacterized protein n=1 Tax=Allacma fusca TaxID=39272 RepID=A0A8J2PMU9_9HEXA|nr:unnamed protein product [Allacma fusca]